MSGLSFVVQQPSVCLVAGRGVMAVALEVHADHHVSHCGLRAGRQLADFSLRQPYAQQKKRMILHLGEFCLKGIPVYITRPGAVIRQHGQHFSVILTILSTVLGLVPFFADGSGAGRIFADGSGAGRIFADGSGAGRGFIDGAKESFWFSFAVGSTGGLLFFILALVLVMPIFFKLKTETE